VAVSIAMASGPAAARMGDPRSSTAPSAVAWPDDDSAPSDESTKALSLDARPASKPVDGDEDRMSGEAPEPPAQPSVPRPQPVMQEQLAVAVGLSPEAPGSKQERALLDRLARSAEQSTRPTHVRRLRAGAGDARRICRERRDDLVIMIGYLPEREEPVVLAHDCKLDVPLSVRGLAAIDEPGLVAALWDEHDELVRQGYSERRRLMRIGPRARAGIIGGVVVVVVGVAVGLLVANALRDERVVLKVRP
jgi:hypothetical protein